MLHLKSHHFSLQHTSGSHPLRLSPVASEDDELIQAIEASHEEIWRLDPTPDSRSLAEFWSGVEDDISKDPEWFSFATDEE